jgi:hypothetical protein
MIATVPSDDDVVPVSRAIDRLTPDGDWTTAFDDASERRGPAHLAYRGETMRRPGGSDAIEPRRADDDDVLAFLQAMSQEDRDEAGIETSTSLLACIRSDDRVVAAAGYRVWLDDTAHLLVLVDPRYRGQQMAMKVAASATHDALARGFLAQWRAQSSASRAVARKLGYVEIGQQMSIRLE